MSIFLLSFATFVVTVQSNEAGCTIAVVGSSPESNTKSITIDSRFRCPTTVDNTNWLDGEGIYSVTQVGNQLTIFRTDIEEYDLYDEDTYQWYTFGGGWDRNLKFRCCSGDVKIYYHDHPTCANAEYIGDVLEIASTLQAREFSQENFIKDFVKRVKDLYLFKFEATIICGAKLDTVAYLYGEGGVGMTVTFTGSAMKAI